MKKEFYEKQLAEINAFKKVDIIKKSGQTAANDTPFPFG